MVELPRSCFSLVFFFFFLLLSVRRIPIWPVLGYDVAYYVPPAFLTLFPFRMEQLCNSVAVALKEHHDFISDKRNKTIPMHHHLDKSAKKKKLELDQPAPLLFHVFSNNGYFNFCFLLHYIKHGHPSQTYLLDLIKGTVVDSAPSSLTPEVLTRGSHEELDRIFISFPDQLSRVSLRYCWCFSIEATCTSLSF